MSSLFKFSTIILLLLTLNSFAEFKLTIQNNFGFTFVDLEEKLGMPMYSKQATVNYSHIANWNYFFYKGGVEAVIWPNRRYGIGAEAGFYRWYFWSYRWRYSSSSSYTYNWRTVRSIHYGLIFQFNPHSNIYLTVGPGAHTMLQGQGTYFGLTSGIAYEIPLTDRFSLLINFRYDFVPSNSSFSSINAGIGISFSFN